MRWRNLPKQKAEPLVDKRLRSTIIDNPIPVLARAEPGRINFIFAAAISQDHRPLYRCPVDPEEELRLTWDGIRQRHAGFCKKCENLWPLPRRTIRRKQIDTGAGEQGELT